MEDNMKLSRRTGAREIWDFILVSFPVWVCIIFEIWNKYLTENIFKGSSKQTKKETGDWHSMMK